MKLSESQKTRVHSWNDSWYGSIDVNFPELVNPQRKKCCVGMKGLGVTDDVRGFFWGC